MSLVDRTNEFVALSLHDGESVTGDPVELNIDVDFDSSYEPDEWVWFMFDSDDEPWFKLTYEEAEKVYDRLGRVLGYVRA